MGNIIIGPGRLSFPYLFTPQQGDNGERYAVTLLLPPDADLTPIHNALGAAAVEKWGADKSKWPKNMRGPKQVLRDAGEKAHLAGYLDGWHFVSLGSKEQPGVIDAVKTPVTDQKEVYPGRWARVSVRAFAYQNKTTGVGLGMQNVQLLRHDAPFGGRSRAVDDFDEMAAELGGDQSGGGASGWDT